MVCIGVSIKSRQNAIFWSLWTKFEAGWQDMGGTQPKDSKNLGQCENSSIRNRLGIGTHGNAF